MSISNLERKNISNEEDSNQSDFSGNFSLNENRKKELDPNNFDINNPEDRAVFWEMYKNRYNRFGKPTTVGITKYDQINANTINDNHNAKSQEENTSVITTVEYPPILWKTSPNEFPEMKTNSLEDNSETDDILTLKDLEGNKENKQKNPSESSNFDEIKSNWEAKIKTKNAPRGFMAKTWDKIQKFTTNKYVKTIGGTALCLGAVLAAPAIPAALGAGSLVLLPLAYGLGAKYCLEGITEIIQRKFCNGDKLKNNLDTIEKNIENNLAKLNNLEKSPENHARITQLQLALTAQNLTFQEQKTIYQKWSAKHAAIRSVIGTVGSIGAGVGLGVPLGFQQFSGSGHTVFWSLKDGLSFVYNNPTEIIGKVTTFNWFGQSAHTLTNGIPQLSNFLWRAGLLGTGAVMCADVYRKATNYLSINRPTKQHTPLTPHEMQQKIITMTSSPKPADIPIEATSSTIEVKEDSEPKTEVIRSIPTDPKKESEKKQESEIYPAFDTPYPEIKNLMTNIINNRLTIDHEGNIVSNLGKGKRQVNTESLIFGHQDLRSSNQPEQLSPVFNQIKQHCLLQIANYTENRTDIDILQYKQDWQKMFIAIKSPELYEKMIAKMKISDDQILVAFANDDLITLTKINQNK